MDLKGSLVLDMARIPVGHVHEVLLSPDTLTARWLLVCLVDSDVTVLVPAAAASEVAPGELLVPYSTKVIIAAPHAKGTALTEPEAARLMQHYGFSSVRSSAQHDG